MRYDIVRQVRLHYSVHHLWITQCLLYKMVTLVYMRLRVIYRMGFVWVLWDQMEYNLLRSYKMYTCAKFC